MYLGIESIGPGLYSAMPATMSSKQVGLRFFMKSVMPPLSSWNMPFVLPSAISLYTSGSSMSIDEKSMSTPWFSFIMRSASRMTVRFLSPRKSIFRSPSSSIVVMLNCVATPLSDE